MQAKIIILIIVRVAPLLFIIKFNMFLISISSLFCIIKLLVLKNIKKIIKLKSLPSLVPNFKNKGIIILLNIIKVDVIVFISAKEIYLIEKSEIPRKLNISAIKVKNIRENAVKKNIARYLETTTFLRVKGKLFINICPL